MPEITDAIDALDPSLLAPYRDDPGSIRSIEAFLAMLPDDKARLLALTTLASANVRFDDPTCKLFVGIVGINARFQAAQLQTIFANSEALHTRANELRSNLATLTNTVAEIGTEVGGIGTQISADVEGLRGELVSRVQTAAVALDEVLTDVTDRAAELQITQRTIGETTSALTRDLAQMVPKITEPVGDRVVAALDARLAKITAELEKSVRAIAAQAATEELAEQLPALRERLDRLSNLIADETRDLERGLVTLDTRAVRLHPLLARYMDLASLPSWLISAFGVAVLLVGGVCFFAGLHAR